MFGDYLKLLRNSKGISQHKLMELSGVSNAEICRIETGERKNPSPFVLKAFAPHLDVSYEELLTRAGYIEETIEHKGYTEKIYKDEQGNLVDIVKRAKDMYEKNSRWANTAYRVSQELSKADIAAIQAIADALLDKKTK